MRERMQVKKKRITVLRPLKVNCDISDPTGKKTPTSHVRINVNTSLRFAMECARQQTRGPRFVEMTPALSQELGMLTTTETVETGAFTSLNNVTSIQIHALQCTILVARMIMDDVSMMLRASAILNVATDVFGRVPGLFITTYLVQMSACIGRQLNFYTSFSYITFH